MTLKPCSPEETDPEPTGLSCAGHVHVLIMAAERATERVAVLMTPSEKAVYADRASSLGLSLGQFFREAGAAYSSSSKGEQANVEALEAALKQLEISTSRTEQTLDQALLEVRSAIVLQDGSLKEHQRRIDDLNGRIIRLETVLRRSTADGPGLGSRMVQLFAGLGLDDSIEPFEGEQAQPADFGL